MGSIMDKRERREREGRAGVVCEKKGKGKKKQKNTPLRISSF